MTYTTVTVDLPDGLADVIRDGRPVNQVPTAARDLWRLVAAALPPAPPEPGDRVLSTISPNVHGRVLAAHDAVAWVLWDDGPQPVTTTLAVIARLADEVAS